MNKKYKSMIGIIAIVVIIACAYSWFHVSGREIDGVSGISEGCSVTVRIGRDDYQEYVFNAEQIVSLKTLILNCSFTRDLSSVVYYPVGTKEYTIIVDYNNQRDFLIINGIGNDYISISTQFGGKHLKVNNSEWEQTLNQIIALSTRIK